MIVERETFTTDQLLTKLAHQPLLSFAVWKKALSRGTQWNWMFGKARHDSWFFCPGCILCINMNQRLHLFFHYLRQGTTFLVDSYFVSEGHQKRRCFLSKRCLNSIFLQILKLNSLALLINKFSILSDAFNDLHFIGNKLKRWYVFLFNFFKFW